jgi:hypothetical protein
MKTFNLYWNGGGKGYFRENLSAQEATDQALAILILGGEVTGIINAKDDE